MDVAFNANKIEKVFANHKTTVPVVFATDKNFIPYLYVALQSLVDNSSEENNYDIVILCTDIDEYKQNQFKQLEKENISVRFFEMSGLMSEYKDVWYTHWHYTEAMYYRFFIPQLFEQYDKIVYLDCDVVINFDIAEFYNIDLENKGLGAIVGLARQHKDDKYTSYIENTVGIKRENYFNSGVLLFNNTFNQKEKFFEKCIGTLNSLKEPVFPDQDVLNIIFKDNVKYLDISYNFSWNMIHYYKNSEENISEQFREGFIKASKNPKILHFAGGQKPWVKPYLSYSDYFWKYARKTPFYEELIYKHSAVGLDRNAIYNAVYRKRIYLKYLKCKMLKLITFGKKREHYKSKAKCLKKMIKDYRKTLKK